MERITILDGTLREGEQTPGVFFTLEEKLMIARELDLAGVELLDVGMPAVSEEERQAIAAITAEGLRPSIGVTVRLKADEIDQAVFCRAREIFLICPVSESHIHGRLRIDEAQLATIAGQMIQYAVDRGLKVNLVAEDAARSDMPFLLDVICRAHELGASRAFICDTVGVMEPFGMKALVSQIRAEVPRSMELGVHCHNDLGLATANTLAAMEAGVAYPSVTVNGIGERAGNAPLHEVAVLTHKILKAEHGIDMHRLYDLSRTVEKCSGIFITPHTPVVGLNTFRHESGIHIDGILKNTETYVGLDPGHVNRAAVFVLGKHTGTQTIRHLLEHRGYHADEAEIAEILRLVKDRKSHGGKEEIKRMARDIERFYEQCLTFPLETFWEIVEEVLDRDENGSRLSHHRTA